MLVYDRIEPEGRCVSPDGHEWQEVFTFRSSVPESCWCPRCMKQWTIVTHEEPES